MAQLIQVKIGEYRPVSLFDINNIVCKRDDMVVVEFEKGFEITGLDGQVGDTILFQSGTKKEEAKIVTSGGRVLSVTTLAPTMRGAVNKSKERLRQIKYEGMYYRKDIGFEFL